MSEYDFLNENEASYDYNDDFFDGLPSILDITANSQAENLKNNKTHRTDEHQVPKQDEFFPESQEYGKDFHEAGTQKVTPNQKNLLDVNHFDYFNSTNDSTYFQNPNSGNDVKGKDKKDFEEIQSSTDKSASDSR